MPDGVNAPVDSMQPAHSHPIRHRLAGQAENDELGKGDDSVLSGGQLREPSIQRGSLKFVNS